MSTAAFINELCLAQKNLTLSAHFKRLDRFDLITLDELGYTPQSQEGADLFFQLISQRYERKSLLITTNLVYSEWDKVFLSKTSTAAAVDRINCFPG
jgi:DNA replication protein DnaC